MVEKYKLKNKIAVAEEYLENYHSVSFAVVVKAGSVNESEHTNGMAHVIEHMLFKGTCHRTARDIADAMTEIGGHIDAFTTKEYTCYYARTLSEHLYQAIEIIADMLKNSKIAPEDLDRELGVIGEEIDMYDDSPEDIVHEQLQRAIWQMHPLGYLVSGEKETVKQFKRRDVLDFIKRYYIPERMVIAISGNFDSIKTRAIVEKLFGDIPAGGYPEEEILNPAVAVPVYQAVCFKKQMDIEQMHITMAYPCLPCEHPDKYCLMIMNNLLGGNLNSRLFQIIREEMGLAYAIYSYDCSYESAGLFQIYAAVQPENVRKTVMAAASIMNDMKKTLVGARELRIAKEQIKTELYLSDESTYNRMSSYGEALIHHVAIDEVETVLKRVEQITAEELMDFAKKYFIHERVSLSLVGNLTSMPERPEEIYSTLANGDK